MKTRYIHFSEVEDTFDWDSYPCEIEPNSYFQDIFTIGESISFVNHIKTIKFLIFVIIANSS